MQQVERDAFLSAMEKLDAWPAETSGWSDVQEWKTDEGKLCGKRINYPSEVALYERKYFICE